MGGPHHDQLRSIVDELRRQLAEMTTKLAQLESTLAPVVAVDVGDATPSTSNRAIENTDAAVSSHRSVPHAARDEDRPDEAPIAISAAVAAFLGQRARVRPIRLVSSSTRVPWGRVSTRDSHRRSG